MFPSLQRKLFYCMLLVFASVKLAAQPYTSIDVSKDKPKEYQNRQLRAEKTDDVKYTKGVRFYQNMVTHYNYWFNANTKINDIISNAKDAHRDDYAELLSFYNYTLDATAAQKVQLDSVIYKCNAGILLHDLRNDWIDDMYLLLGKAYFLKEKFDSAHHVFQYINYIYAPKDDGYDLPIGSNGANNSGIFTVSTAEKSNKLKRAFVNPPVRNESLLWLIRTYLEQNKIDEATGLIEILKADPNFPQRLQPALNELSAYNFYQQRMYDSAAAGLQKSLHNASDINERARWEYLCGQMYQLASENSLALGMFKSAMSHATDPYMDAYARLNIVGLYAANNKENALKDNLAELYKLAKRAKYEDYRDIIYYAAAVLEKQQNNTDAAIADLKKALDYGADNQLQRQKNLLLLSDIYYAQKDFKSAYENYSKINISALVNSKDKDRINDLKGSLKTVVENSDKIHLQDSLLYLASLPEPERLSAVKKVYKQLRKEKGLKESADDANFDYGSWNRLNNLPASVSFANSAGNDFYFRNQQVKQQGFNDFKTLWGNRPNVDNWQRQSAIKSVSYSSNVSSTNLLDVDRTATVTKETEPASMQALLSNIPLTDVKTKAANDAIANGLYDNAQIFQNKLEEYPSAIQSYSTLLKRYPGFKNEEKAIFNLAYCFLTTENMHAFDSLKNLLNSKYPQGVYTYRINKGEILDNNDSSVTVGTFTKDYISRKYNEIYNLFIEGNFKEAEEEKVVADKSFGKKFWTPQLAYIEAIYYVTRKNDSVAVNRLQHIVSTFPQSPIAAKALTMLDVLKRKDQIEEYLTNLRIDSTLEFVERRIDLDTNKIAKVATRHINSDSIMRAAPVVKKMDNAPIIVNNAIKPATVAVDSFTFNPADSHYVMVILNKVDEVYVNETKNAFGRYNQQQYPTQKIGMGETKKIEQYSLVLVGPFPNVIDAMSYYDKTKSLVSSRIVPWLTKEKYSLSFIGNTNLEKIKTAEKIEEYSKFIKNLFPDRF